MAYKTKVSDKHVTTVYTTKHMRLDLLDRVRILAVARHETVETVINRVLEVGWPVVWRLTFEGKGKQAPAVEG